MRLSFKTLALACTIAGAAFCAPVMALAQTTEDIRVDLNLKDADMLAATRMLTAQTGLQFIVAPTDKPFNKITLSLTGVTAEDAIRYICQSAGAFFKKDENGVYIISQTQPTEIKDPAAEMPAMPKKKLRVHKIKLMKADPEQVLRQMIGVPFDPNHGFKEINNFSELTNPSSRHNFSTAPMYLLGAGSQGTPSYTPVTSQQFGQTRTSGESGGDIALPGEKAGQFGGGGPGGGFGGGFGGQGPGGGGPGGGFGQGNGQQGLQPGGLIPQGLQFITFDPNDNSIIVQGTDEQIRELQDAIAFFDVAPKQVVIKVEFITTSSSVARSLGFEFFFQRGTIFAGPTPGSFVRTSDPVFLNFATGNITARMRALVQEGSGRVVSAPVLRTLNNQPAVVNQTISTTVFVTNQTVTAGGIVVQTVQPLPRNIVTGLAVRPRINEDGTITMFLQPQVSDLGQLRRPPGGAQGTEIPDVLSQTISVVARVRNADTIALAGLTRKSDTGSVSKIPILADLPIIGQFFRFTTRDVNYSELIIFVTPTIVEDDTGTEGIGP